MRRSVTVVLVSVATLVSGGVAASAHSHAAPTPVSRIGTPGALVVGAFDSTHVGGTSTFLQTPVDGSGRSRVYVTGSYAGLDRFRPYFTSAYGNDDCDPAQAFPVGPFVSDGSGKAILAGGVASDFNGTTADIAGARSVSIRIGDQDKDGRYTDQDHDGIFGGGDVVAVPGKPRIGLVRCDSSPSGARP